MFYREEEVYTARLLGCEGRGGGKESWCLGEGDKLVFGIRKNPRESHLNEILLS